MISHFTSTFSLEGLRRHILCPRCDMKARVCDGVLMVDGDVTWFDGERDTWNV
jgi:hypothetical protein